MSTTPEVSTQKRSIQLQQQPPPNGAQQQSIVSVGDSSKQYSQGSSTKEPKPRSGIRFCGKKIQWPNLIFIVVIMLIIAGFIFGIQYAYNDNSVFFRSSTVFIWRTATIQPSNVFGPIESDIQNPQNTSIALGLQFSAVDPSGGQVSMTVEPLFISDNYTDTSGALTTSIIVRFNSFEFTLEKGSFFEQASVTETIEFDSADRFLYPFDKYTTILYVVAVEGANQTIITPALVYPGANVGTFKVSAKRSTVLLSGDALEVQFTFTRRSLGIVYPMFVTIAMFLIFLVNMAVAYFIIFLRARKVEGDIVAAYFGALFALPTLRSSQPGVVEDFGILQDWVSFYWCMASSALLLVILATYYVVQDGYVRKLRQRREEKQRIRQQQQQQQQQPSSSPKEGTYNSKNNSNNNSDIFISQI